MFRVSAAVLGLSLVVLCGCASSGKSAAKAPAGSGQPQFHLSPVIYKDLQPIGNFIYGEATTTFAKMEDALNKTFFPLMENEGENGVAYDYPAIFIYRGASQDETKPFTLQTGFPCKPEVKAAGDFKVREVEGMRCASVYYTGPLMHIGSAYETIMGEVFKAGHRPTGETRELYLFWDGEESANTIVEIQVGIEAAKDAPKPAK